MDRDRRRERRFVLGPEIFHELIRLEDVAADLVSPRDIAFRRFVSRAVFLALGELYFVEASLQHLQRRRAVLVLASLGAADDLDAGRQVLHAHRRFDLVHVLPALSSGAHGRDFQVPVRHLDVDLVFDVGLYFHRRERRLAASISVEGTDPDETVDTGFRPQVAVGIWAGCDERGAVDARSRDR